ncbi:MAG: hypothetical protein JSW13_03705, partial [Candidatus Aerophobus sp.]
SLPEGYDFRRQTDQGEQKICKGKISYGIGIHPGGTGSQRFYSPVLERLRKKVEEGLFASRGITISVGVAEYEKGGM